MCLTLSAQAKASERVQVAADGGRESADKQAYQPLPSWKVRPSLLP